MSSMSECLQQKYTQRAPSTKTECDYLYGGIEKKKKKVTYAKISPKMLKPRDKTGKAKEEAEDLSIVQIFIKRSK